MCCPCSVRGLSYRIQVFLIEILEKLQRHTGDELIEIQSWVDYEPPKQCTHTESGQAGTGEDMEVCGRCSAVLLRVKSFPEGVRIVDNELSKWELRDCPNWN